MEFAEIFAALKITNEKRCTEVAPVKDIRAIAQRICKYSAGKVILNGHYDTRQEQHDEGAPASAQASFVDPDESYPAPLGPDAYFGIAGRFVKLVEPHTEADPSFLLILFLVYAGDILGRNAYVWAGGDRHHSNLYVCAVGPTSGGRKGSATGPVEMFFGGIDDEWVKSIQSGLSFGEGLIWCVRDPIFQREKMKGEKGTAEKYEQVCVDEGVADKRLLVRQSEFFGALQVMKRQGNTLSPILRDAWDRDNLKTMTKNSPANATNAHISIVGNITKEELLRGMLCDEMDNGFANRFLWACSRRSKALPEGGKLWKVKDSPELAALRADFNRIHGTVSGPVVRDPEAADIWGRDDVPGVGMYAELTRERQGLFGLATARAAPIVLRLSLVYALLDGSTTIRREHLDAAYEVWRYCEESAHYIFGDTLSDAVADTILKALRGEPLGLTRTDISRLFAKNKSKPEIDNAIKLLQNKKLVRDEEIETKGRPAHRLFAMAKEGSSADPTLIS